MSVYALITSGSSCVLKDFQVAVESDTRMPVVQSHGWLVAAVEKVEYFFINMLVRINVSQSHTG